jgi:hypothetical protein
MRAGRLVLDLARQVVAVVVEGADVHDQDLVGLAAVGADLQLQQRLAAPARGVAFDAVASQRLVDEAAHDVAVVDDYHAQAGQFGMRPGR